MMKRHGLGIIGLTIVILSASVPCGAKSASMKITSPQAGDVLAPGKVPVRVWFDANGVVPATGYQLTIDSKHHTSARFPMPLSYGQGTLLWDASGAKPGVHAVRVKLYRDRRLIGIAGVKVLVAGLESRLPESLASLPSSDSVRIMSPRSGDELSGRAMVAIQAQPSTGGRLAWIQLYLDDRMIGLLNSPPYEVGIDTARVADGEHLLTALAVDDSGRRERSQPVAVRVINGEQPPEVVGPGPTPGPVAPPPMSGPPILTQAPPAPGQPVLEPPEVPEPPELAISDPKLMPPGEAPTTPTPPPVAVTPDGKIAPASLIKPYVPGQGIPEEPSSTVGAPGVGDSAGD